MNNPRQRIDYFLPESGKIVTKPRCFRVEETLYFATNATSRSLVQIQIFTNDPIYDPVYKNGFEEKKDVFNCIVEYKRACWKFTEYLIYVLGMNWCVSPYSYHFAYRLTENAEHIYHAAWDEWNRLNLGLFPALDCFIDIVYVESQSICGRCRQVGFLDDKYCSNCGQNLGKSEYDLHAWNTEKNDSVPATEPPAEFYLNIRDFGEPLNDWYWN